MFRRFSLHRNAIIALVAFALAVRMLVPQGWMPSSVEGQIITICTGVDGMTTAVLGKDGKLHKSPSGEHKKSDNVCVFTGTAMAATLPDALFMETLSATGADESQFSRLIAAIGQGLAAPPPPSTGPPIWS